MTRTRTIDDLHFAINDIVAVHGARRVLLAALRALLHPPPRPRRTASPHALNDHLRRDIGLPGSAANPPHWTRYL